MGSGKRGSSTEKEKGRNEREKESSAGIRTCHSEWCWDRLILSCNVTAKFCGWQSGVGGELSEASNVIPCVTGPLHCHAWMLGQPSLQPDSGRGRSGIHRCLPEEDQLFWGTLIKCLTPDAWWSGYHAQTSRVFLCCKSRLLWCTLISLRNECAGGFGYC